MFSRTLNIFDLRMTFPKTAHAFRASALARNAHRQLLVAAQKARQDALGLAHHLDSRQSLQNLPSISAAIKSATGSRK
jgi:hypothetical protein